MPDKSVVNQSKTRVLVNELARKVAFKQLPFVFSVCDSSRTRVVVLDHHYVPLTRPLYTIENDREVFRCDVNEYVESEYKVELLVRPKAHEVFD